jgi:hypothetical protein
VLFKRKHPPLAVENASLVEGGEMAEQPAGRARPAREKLGWFEKRQRRRRRRIIFEEVLGWILVPAIIYLVYWVIQSSGGIPKEISDFANEIIAAAMKGKS